MSASSEQHLSLWKNAQPMTQTCLFFHIMAESNTSWVPEIVFLLSLELKEEFIFIFYHY